MRSKKEYAYMGPSGALIPCPTIEGALFEEGNPYQTGGTEIFEVRSLGKYKVYKEIVKIEKKKKGKKK